MNILHTSNLSIVYGYNRNHKFWCWSLDLLTYFESKYFKIVSSWWNSAQYMKLVL